jgi:autotransporter-associated beta strand protein
LNGIFGTGSLTVATFTNGTFNFVGSNAGVQGWNNYNTGFNFYSALITSTNLDFFTTHTGGDFNNLYASNNFTGGTIGVGANMGAIANAGPIIMSVYGTNYGGSYIIGNGTTTDTLNVNGMITNAPSITLNSGSSMTISNGASVNVTNFTVSGFLGTVGTITINDTNQAVAALNGLTNFGFTNASLTVNSGFTSTNGTAISSANPLNIVMTTGDTLTFNNASTNATNNTFGSSTVTLNGGTFTYSAASSTNTHANINTLALGSGFTSFLNTTAGASGTNVLGIGSLTVGTSSTLQTALAGAGSTNGLIQLISTNGVPLVGGILPWAVDTSSNNFLTYTTNTGTGTNYLVANTTFTNLAASPGTTNSASNAVAGANAVTFTGNNAYNSLVVSNTVALGSGTLSLTSGGLMFAKTAMTISGGTLTSDTNTSSSNTNFYISTEANTATISSIIANGGANTLNLIKADTGTLILSGSNSYTGQTLVEAGTLVLTNGGNIVSSIANIQPGAAFNYYGGTYGTVNAQALSTVNLYASYGGTNSGLALTMLTNSTLNLQSTTNSSNSVTFTGAAGIVQQVASVTNTINVSGVNTLSNNGVVLTGKAQSTLKFISADGTGNTTFNNTGQRHYAGNLEFDSGAWLFTGADRFGMDGNASGAAQTFTVGGGTLTVNQTGYGIRFNGDSGANGGGTTGSQFIGTQTGGIFNITAGASAYGLNMGSTSAAMTLFTLSGGLLNISGANPGLWLGSDTAGSGTTTFSLGGGTLSVAGTISGSQGANAKQDFVWTGGTLAFGTLTTANLAFASNTTVTGVASTFTNSGGVLAVGGVGVAGLSTITGNYVQNSNGVLALDITGTNKGTGFTNGSSYYDLLSVSGTALYGGTVALNMTGYDLATNASSTLTLATNAFSTASLTNATLTAASTSTNGISGNYAVGGFTNFSFLNTNGYAAYVLNSSATNLTFSYGTNSYVSGNWGTGGAGSWSLGIDPNSTKTVALFGSGSSTNVTLDANRTVGGLIFTNASGYAITGNGSSTLTLDGSTFGGNAVVKNQLGNQTIAAPVVLKSTVEVSNSGASQSVTFGGAISGNGGLQVDSNGSTILTGADTASGQHTVNSGGVLTVTNGGSLANGALAVNGTLNLGSTANSGPGLLSGNGTISQSNGTLTLASGNNSFSGTDALKAGALVVGGSSTLNNATINQTGGSLSVAAGGAIGTLTVTNSGSSAMINGSAGTVTLNNGSSLYGMGTLGAVTLNTGATISSGGTTGLTSGTLTVSSLIVNGGTYTWNYQGSVNDLIYSTAAINFTNLSGANQLKITAITNSSSAAWPTGSTNFTIMTANGGFTSFNAANIDIQSFRNLSGGVGNWSINTNGNNLVVSYQGGQLYTLVAAPGTTTSQSAVTNAFSGGNLSSVALSGGGEYILDLTNSYGGQTTIGAGTLTATGTNSFAQSSSIQVGTLTNSNAAATLNINTAGGVVTNAITVAGNGLNTITGTNAGVVTYGGNVALNTNVTLASVAGGDVILSGTVSGAGTATVSGAGTVTLAAGNTYSGGTVLNSGTLAVSNNAALGSGTLTVTGNSTVQALTSVTLANNATITNGVTETLDANGNNLTNSGNISGSGASLTAHSSTGTGTLTLSGSNSYTGASTVNSGTLVLGNSNALPSVTTLTVAGTGSLNLNGYNASVATLSDGGISTGTITNSGTSATLAVTGSGASTFGGSIGGTLGVTKSGVGTLTLNGNDTYSGATLVSGGGLILNGSLSNSAITVTNSSFNEGSTGTIAGTNGLTVQSNGAVTLGGVNTYTGNTAISNGASLTLTNAGLLGSGSYAGLITNNGTLTMGQSGSQTLSGVISGAGSITQSGGGVTVLTTNNTYTGGTLISGGTLQIGNGIGTTGSTALGTGTVTDNANLFINFAGSAPSTTTITNVINGTGTVTLVNSNVGPNNSGYAGTYLSASNSFAAMVVNAGTAVGTNDYNFGAGNGTLTLNGGELANAGSLGNLTLGAARTLILGTNGGYVDNNNTKSVTINSQITGPGGLAIVFDGGSTILGGSNNYAGPTTVGTNNGPYVWSNSSSVALLTLSNNNALPSNTALVFGATVAGFNNSGTLNLNAYNATVGSVTGSTNGFIKDNVAGASTLTIALNTNATFGGVIQNGTGPVSVVVSGTGTQTLSGVNTYTGGTTVNGGTLILSAANTFTNGTVLNGGILDLAHTNAVQSSTVTLNGGSLNFDSAVTGNSFLLGGLAGSSSLVMTNTRNGAITLSVGNNNASTTYSGNISDGGVGSSLTKVSAGTLTLTGNNSYTGLTTLSGGVLGLGSANAIGGSSTLSFSGGTLQYSAANTTDYSSWFSTNTGQLFKFDLNGQNVTFANGLTNGGTTTLSVINSTLGGGTLTLAGVNTFSGNITDNSTLNLANSGSQTLSGFISGTGTLIQSGSGTTVLTSGSSAFSNTVVNAGTLNLAATTGTTSNGRNGTVAGTLTINAGGTVNLLVANAIGYQNSGGYNSVTNITINGGTLNDAYSGTANLNSMGYVTSLFMTGGTVASTTNNSAFNFTVGTGVTTYATNTSAIFSDNITLQGNGITFNVAKGTVPSGYDLIVSGSIGQSGGIYSLNKTGLGTMELTASNSFSGAATITQGTLDLAHSNAALNSVVTLNGGTVTFDSTAGNNFNLGGLASTAQVGATNLVLTNTAGSALNLTVGNGNASATFLGNLSDNGSATITKVGTGYQAIAGDLSGFTGALKINGGTVYLSNSLNQTLGGNIILSGGALNQNGSGTTTLTGNLSNTTNGTSLFVSGGALAFNSGFALTNASFTFQNGGQALFTNGTVNTFASSSGYNTFTINGTNGSLGAAPTLLVSNGSVLTTVVNISGNYGGWSANNSAIVIGSNSSFINSASASSYTMDGGGSVQIAQSGLFSNQVYQFKIGVTGSATNVITNAGTVLMTLGNPAGLIVGNGAGGLNEVLNSGTFGLANNQGLILGVTGVTNNATNLFFNYAGATFSNNGGLTIGQGQSSLNELSNSGTMTFGTNLYVGYSAAVSGTNLVYLGGGSLTMTNGIFYIGNGGSATNIVTVDNGATLKLVGGLMGGAGSPNDQLTILSGGKVIMSSQFYLGYGSSGSSNQVTVNAGATFTNSSNLQYQNLSGGNSNSVIFTNNGGLVTVSSINEGWGSTNTANLSVYGQGSGTTTLSVSSYIGQGIATNNTNQIIVSGGLFTNSSSLTLGNAGTSNNNLLLVTGASFYGCINNIGAGGTNNINSFLFSASTSSNSQALAIGSGGLNNSNGATISSGSFTESSTIAVGSGGTNNTNTLLISGGSVTASTNITIGSGGSNNVNILQLTGGSLTTPGTISAGTSSNVDGFLFTGGTLVASNITATGSNWTAANSSISNNTFYNTNAGILAPGTVGTAGKLNITGNYVQGGNAAMAIDLNGSAPATVYQSFPGSYYDTVAVSSNATLGGDLLLSIGNGFAPASNNSFSVLTASNVTGMINGAHTSLVNGATMVVATDGLSIFKATNTGTALNLTNYTFNQYAGGAWGSGGASSWTAVDPNSGVYTAYFGTNGGSGSVVMDQNRTVSALVFSNAVASSLTASGGSVLTLTNNAGVTTNASLTVSAGGLTLKAPVNLQSGLVITDTAGTSVDVKGNISESVTGSGVTIASNNTGLVTFYGTNSYTGATVVNGGYLDLTGTNALAAANLNTNKLSVGTGATLIFGVGGSNAYSSAQINAALASGAFKSGSGIGYDATGTNFTLSSLGAVSSLTLAGSGTATVNQDNSGLTGGIALLGGTLAVDPSTTTANALGGSGVSISLNSTNASKIDLGGTVQAVGNIRNNNALGGMMVLTNGVLNIAPGNSGNIATFGGLQESADASIVSPGIVALTTVNGSYSSSSNGVSVLAGSNAVSQFYLQGGSLALENNHALDGSILTITAPVSLLSTAGFTNAGAVSVDFSGSSSMNIAGTIDFGAASVNAGTTTLNVASNGALVLTNGVSGGALTKAGSGTLILGGSNGTAGTTLNGGTILALGANSLGANLTLSSGLLDLGGNTDTFSTVGFYGTNYTVTNGSFAVTSGYTASNTAIAQSLSGGATFTSLGGNVYLTNANTYTGATLVTGGTLYSSLNTNTTYTVTNAGSTFVAGAAIDTNWTAASVASVKMNNGTILAIDATGTNFALNASLTNGANFTLGTYGTGTVTLADSATNYTGVSMLAISSGTLDLGGVSAPSQMTLTNVTVSGGTVRNGTLSTTNLVIATNATATIAATITGTNGLTIASGDLITLATNNTFTGATTVNSNGVLSFKTMGYGYQNSSITVNSGGALTFTNNGSVTTLTNYITGYTTNSTNGVVSTNYGAATIALNAGSTALIANGATLNIGSSPNTYYITITGSTLTVGNGGTLNAQAVVAGRSYSINGGGTLSIASGGSAFFGMYDNNIGASGGGTNLLTNAGTASISGLCSGGGLGNGATGLNMIANTGLMTNGTIYFGAASAPTATNILVNYGSGTLVGGTLSLGRAANSGVNEFLNYGTASEGSVLIGDGGYTNTGSFNVVTNTGTLSLTGTGVTLAVGNGGTNNFLYNSGLLSNTGGSMQVGYSSNANGINLVTNAVGATMYQNGGIILGNWADTANNNFVNNGTVFLGNNLTVGNGGQVNTFLNNGLISNSASLQIGWSTNTSGLNAVTNTASGNMTMWQVQLGNGSAGTNIFYNAGTFTYIGMGGTSINIGQNSNSTGLNEIILAGGVWSNTMATGVAPWMNIGYSTAQSGTNIFSLSGGAQYIGGITTGNANWRQIYMGIQGSQANILTNNGGLITNVVNLYVGNGSSNNANTVYVGNGTITTVGGNSGNGITVGNGGVNATNTMTVASGGLVSGNNLNLGAAGSSNNNTVAFNGGSGNFTTISVGAGSTNNTNTVQVASGATLSGNISLGGGGSNNYNQLQIFGSGTVTGTSQFYVGSGGVSNTNTMSVASGGVFTNSNWIQMQGANSTDLFTNNGGSVTANGFLIGAYGASNSSITYAQGSGTTTIGGYGIRTASYGGNLGNGNTNKILVAGGLFNSTNNSTILGEAGTNNLNIFQVDGGQANLSTVTMGATTNTNSSGGTNQINLNGGTLALSQITAGAATASAGSVNQVNLNGGTLLAAAGASPTFLGAGVANVAITGSGTINDGGQAITVGATIADGSSVGQLIKAGAGTLTLSGNNTYSAGTLLNAGGVNITTGSSLGSGNLTMAGGTTLGYTGTGASTLANNISLSSGNGTIANSSGSALNLSGNLSDNGSLLTFAKGSYNVSGNITGAYALSNAVMTLSGLNSYSAPASIFAGSTLNLGAHGSLTNSSVLNLGASSDSSKTTNTFNLGGYNQSLTSLATSGGGYNQVINSGSFSTLTLTGTSTFGGSFNGANIGLTIAGGNVTLTGTSSYSGTTTVNGGSLDLGSTAFLTATSNVVVQNGGTLLLGGTSTNQINANTPITMNGGTLSMGGNGSTRAVAQTFSSLTLTGNSVIDFANLTGNSSLTFGTIALNNNSLSIYNWSGTNQYGTQSSTQVGTFTHLYDLNSGSLSSADLNNISFYSGGLGSTFLGNAAFSGNEIVPVPEPGVIVAAALLLGWLLFSNRRLLMAVVTRRRA